MKKYLSILIISVLAFGCSDDWLTLFPTHALADEVVIEKVSDGRIAMSGTYHRLRTYEFYGRNMFVCADAGTADVVLRTDNSNRYNVEYFWRIIPSNAPSTEIWRVGYNTIKRANEVIYRLGLVTPAAGETEEEKDQIIGEAYFIRALVHYDLVKLFAHAYNHTSDASHLGIPYIVESTMVVDHERKTMKECFENIIADAEMALSLMNVDKPANPYTAGKAAVNALLARVYLYMAGPNDGASYAKAAEYAEAVISMPGGYTLVNSENYKISGSNTAFSSPNMWGANFSTESIFVLPYTTSENQATNSLSRIYLDNSKGYGDLKPSEQLMDLFDDEDSRKTIFYFHDGAWCLRKFMGNGTDNWAINNINIFRLSEMYLIAAEGNAKASSPNETKALDFMNRLKTNRGLSAVSLSGQALISEILLERRKELCFEGHALPDHKRLNTSIVRTEDVNNPGNQDYGLTYPNTKFALPIPSTEMNTNKLIVQNDGY